MSKSPGAAIRRRGELADDLRRFQQGQPILARPMGYVERTLRWCRRYPLAVSVLAAVLLGSIAGLAYLSSLSEYFVRQTALTSARLETKMLDEVWRFYSEEIEDIDPKTTNIRITENYRTVHPSLPLPATFAIDLGERISRRSPGMEVRVYSRYPWPGRKDGGPQDEFDDAALAWLEAALRVPASSRRPSTAQFVADDGQRKLLYYTARHMEKSCLGCHNHPHRRQPEEGLEGGRRGRRAEDRPPAGPRDRQHAAGLARRVCADGHDRHAARRGQRRRLDRRRAAAKGGDPMTADSADDRRRLGDFDLAEPAGRGPRRRCRRLASGSSISTRRWSPRGAAAGAWPSRTLPTCCRMCSRRSPAISIAFARSSPPTLFAAGWRRSRATKCAITIAAAATSRGGRRDRGGATAIAGARSAG